MNAGPTSSASGNEIAVAPTVAAAASTRARTSGSQSSAHATATRTSSGLGTWTPGARTRISSTQPRTSAAIGPTWSNDGASGNTPSVGTSPYVGFSPAMPQHAAGIRIEPPLSVPSAASASPATIAAADPPLDPPAVRPGASGFGTTP